MRTWLQVGFILLDILILITIRMLIAHVHVQCDPLITIRMLMCTCNVTQ